MYKQTELQEMISSLVYILFLWTLALSAAIKVPAAANGQYQFQLTKDKPKGKNFQALPLYN